MLSPLNDWLMSLPETQRTILFAGVAVWSFIWKALALWRAAKNDHKYWYVILLFVNSLGILEIVYLYIVQGDNELARKVKEIYEESFKKSSKKRK